MESKCSSGQSNFATLMASHGSEACKDWRGMKTQSSEGVTVGASLHWAKRSLQPTSTSARYTEMREQS